ncbi:hypothetical protein STENM36S_02669 [Streptomyces tendae]
MAAVGPLISASPTAPPRPGDTTPQVIRFDGGRNGHAGPSCRTAKKIKWGSTPAGDPGPCRAPVPSQESACGRRASTTRSSRRPVRSGSSSAAVERNTPRSIAVTSSASTSARREPVRAPSARRTPIAAVMRSRVATVARRPDAQPLEGVEHGAFRRDERGVALHPGAQGLLGREFVQQGRGAVGDTVQFGGVDGLDQCLPGGEVAVEGADADPRVAGDAFERNGVVRGGEGGACGGEEVLAVPPRVCAQRAVRVRRLPGPVGGGRRLPGPDKTRTLR